MTDHPEFPEGYYLDHDQLVETQEGSDFNPAYPNQDHWECDFCSKGVPYMKNPRVGHYMADRVLYSPNSMVERVNNERILSSLATYCEECSAKMLLFPCKGFAEVRLFFDIGEDRKLRSVEVTDISPEDDGIPWNPQELSEKITGVPFEKNALAAGPENVWGPENMVTFFLALGSGVDIRELVKWDGSIDPKLLGQARRKYEKLANSMRFDGNDKRRFRDNIQGNR